jgi:hypothetical protein
MQTIRHIGSKKYDSASTFHLYTIDMDGYEMGLDVLADKQDSVMVTLFHWPDDYDGKKFLSYYPTQAEGVSFLKVYHLSGKRYFLYKGTRVYLPD